MSNPGWPNLAASFPMFGGGKPADAAGTQPLAQGLAGGMDLIRKFWGNLPGGSALPGFLVPTVDIDELDKRLSDLRAAESWLEVNLNMLRATIQGLEVQRNTIAALHSLSAMAEGAIGGKTPAAAAPSAASPAPSTASTQSGLPAGWPLSPAPSAGSGAAPATASASPDASAPAEAAAEATAVPPVGVDPMVNLAAKNWLGFMQDQFMKVAQAAVGPAKPDTAPTPVAARTKPSSGKGAGSARKTPARKARRRASGPA